MENPFKYRIAENPRPFSPGELAHDKLAIEAAVIEGLGTRPTPDTLNDEELMAAGVATVERRRAIRAEMASLHESYNAAFADKAEQEFAQLLADKDTKEPTERKAIADIEHSIELAASLGVQGPRVFTEILGYAGMQEFEDRTTPLFSKEIQDAVHTYHMKAKLLQAQLDIPGQEGNRIQEEIDSREEV